MRRAWLIGCLLIAVLGFSGASALTLDVYFINVGHGDAILVDCGDWEALIDAGRGYPETNKAVLATLDSCVRDDTIELAILSHPHADHYGGFFAVFERYEVLQFWSSSDICPDTCGETFLAFLAAFAREGASYEKLECGDQRRTGCLLWTVLSPSEIGASAAKDNDNENSLVLLLQCGSASFLFAGDLQSASEEEIWQIVLPRGPIAALLPHHAMDESVSECFLQWAHPELVVVSSDANDPDPGVISTLQEKSLRHFATFRDGTICISTDGCTFSEKTER